MNLVSFIVECLKVGVLGAAIATVYLAWRLTNQLIEKPPPTAGVLATLQKETEAYRRYSIVLVLIGLLGVVVERTVMPPYVPAEVAIRMFPDTMPMNVALPSVRANRGECDGRGDCKLSVQLSDTIMIGLSSLTDRITEQAHKINQQSDEIQRRDGARAVAIRGGGPDDAFIVGGES